jgi:hypothetical protein
MATINDLIQTLASALGVERSVVADHARALRGVDMLSSGSTQATIEHAGILLLALMSAPDPKDAPSRVRIYNQLPLNQVSVGGFLPNGQYEGEQVADGDLLLQDLNDLGETFGEYLDGLIWALIEVPGAIDTIPIPARITVGGGRGTTYATVDFLVSAGGIERSCMVSFSLASFGGNRLPDDAPVARLDISVLDISVTVPGSIFEVLRDFFSNTDCPREAALAHVRAGDLQGE